MRRQHKPRVARDATYRRVRRTGRQPRTGTADKQPVLTGPGELLALSGPFLDDDAHQGVQWHLAVSYTPYINGQITQSHGASGYGSTTAICDGTPQPFSIDVTSGGIFGGSGAFKPGKANAQVSISTCDPITWVCSSKYTDAVIRLTK